MRRLLLALAPLPLAACATTGPAVAPAPLQVAAMRQGDSWTADFRFPRRARAWVFIRSALARRGGRP